MAAAASALAACGGGRGRVGGVWRRQQQRRRCAVATAAVAAAARSTCVRANVGVGTPHVMLLWVSDARGVDLSPTQPNAAALSAQVKLHVPIQGII